MSDNIFYLGYQSYTFFFLLLFTVFFIHSSILFSYCHFPPLEKFYLTSILDTKREENAFSSAPPLSYIILYATLKQKLLLFLSMNILKEVNHMINIRKAAIIGCGFVGASTAFSLVHKGLFSELVLIDADQKKAEGEAMDLATADLLLLQCTFTQDPMMISATAL